MTLNNYNQPAPLFALALKSVKQNIWPAAEPIEEEFVLVVQFLILNRFEKRFFLWKLRSFPRLFFEANWLAETARQ